MYSINNQVKLLSLYSADYVGIGEPLENLNLHYDQLLDYCAWLPADEFQLMSLYYFNGYDLKEIGEYLGFSYTRISQKIKDIILKLRGYFGVKNLKYQNGNKRKFSGGVKWAKYYQHSEAI